MYLKYSLLLSSQIPYVFAYKTILDMLHVLKEYYL